eukprot:TRINITY_DN24968_c0_g1_i1.p1 TRINITY_DN24968_c0_g1~~TRINITY_DN24968_c0_g1_i1.p1  ORF type:complete len:219 (-),score=-14.53 TRINITY_DN24968_c0_g1_i1:888-1544(-)
MGNFIMRNVCIVEDSNRNNHQARNVKTYVYQHIPFTCTLQRPTNYKAQCRRLLPSQIWKQIPIDNINIYLNNVLLLLTNKYNVFYKKRVNQFTTYQQYFSPSFPNSRYTFISGHITEFVLLQTVSYSQNSMILSQQNSDDPIQTTNLIQSIQSKQGAVTLFVQKKNGDWCKHTAYKVMIFDKYTTHVQKTFFVNTYNYNLVTKQLHIPTFLFSLITFD